jgi:MFS family permease
LSSVHGPVEAYLAILGLSAAAHAFQVPAASALLPQVVPDKVLANASVWNSSVMHISMVLGPAVGGFQIALQHQASGVYVVDACLNVLYFFLIYAIASRQTTKSTEPVTLKGLLAGMQFIWQSKIILAALTLDLFAVLLGGATMLLPVFTRDILHVGPEGLGWLRAAPSLGALLMALALAYMPPMRNVGRLLIAVVAGFGLSMIGFGLSQVFWVSLVFLFLSGALDNVSVVIRASLLQLRTPDAVRGRVLAVNSVFISSSNELGGFESGLTASLFGPVASVVGGGIGTILVVFAVARAWPELRALDRLEPVQPSISAAGEEMLPQTQEL